MIVDPLGLLGPNPIGKSNDSRPFEPYLGPFST
jgi:hypothetical protein